MTEIQNLFPSQYIHLGGDEVGQKCYFENDSFKEWGKSNNLETIHDFELFYRNTLMQYVNKKPIFWGYNITNLA